MAATALKYNDGKVGLRVQDTWGRTGTIQWVGKLEKKDNAPQKATGHFFGIEYDDDSANPLRSDGEWSGKRYFQCAPRRGLLCKPQDLFRELNPECIKVLRQHFGERVKDWHDFELVKFCIARRFEMGKAIDMIDKHLKWRSEFQPSADEYFPETMTEDYPCGYTGTTDFDENFIYCERPGNAGRCHSSEFVRKYTLPVIARWHACGVEMGMQRMRATDYSCKRVCYIVDLLNVSAMNRPMIGFAQTLAAVEQDNYPENLGRVFIVNCPAFFRFAWKLVKIFIDDRTNKKINFCAAGKAVEVMKTVMPEEEIPSFCGGKSSAWMETNGGVIGSKDPQKAYKGTAVFVPSGTTAEEMRQLEEDAGCSDESPFEEVKDGEVPTPTEQNTTFGSPNTMNHPTDKSESACSPSTSDNDAK